jgi:hypothetical protein
MNYYIVEPEVAGGLGEGTIMSRNTLPPIVTKLHYKFDGWLGDVLLESFPCYIITEETAKKLQAIAATGAAYGDVHVTKSEQFQDMCPNRVLPPFLWLQVTGKPGVDDFGQADDFRLVVSDRVLDVFKASGISNAIVEDF